MAIVPNRRIKQSLDFEDLDMELDLQYISYPGGKERMVVLPESQFRFLERIAATRLSSPKGIENCSSLPQELQDRIASGENPIRILRQWRGLSGRQLAKSAGITASMLSQIECTGKTGSTKTFRAIASLLDVPLDLIFPSHSDGAL